MLVTLISLCLSFLCVTRKKEKSTIKGTKTNFCSPQTKKHTDRIVNHALSVGVLTYKTNVSLEV